MKKSFFTIASLAMVLALVGCSGNQKPSASTSGDGSQSGSASQSDTSSQGGGEAEVPVTEGKVTVYFTATFEGVELPSYASINLAGGFTSWDAGHPELTEVQQLEGTNIFYKQVDAPAAGTIYYKIILGYNSTSGYADSELGVNWTNESNHGYPDDDFGPGDGGNKTIDFAGTEQKVDLGSYKWTAVLSEPVLTYHEDVKMYVDFYEDIPADHHVYIMGGFNSWSATEMVKTTDTDVVRYQAQFTHVLEKSYEFKIKVHPDPLTKDGFNVWDGGFEVNTANASIAVNSLFDRGARNVYGTDVKRFPGNQVAPFVAAEKDTMAHFVGVIAAMYTEQNKKGIFVADRDSAIMVYPNSNNVEGLAVGDTVEVDGKISPYTYKKDGNPVYVTQEVVAVAEHTLIAKVEDHGQEVYFAKVSRELVAGLDPMADINKLLLVEGEITANTVVYQTADDPTSGVKSVTMKVQIAAAEGENEAVEFTVYGETAKNAAAAANMATYAVGDQVSVKGALGYYNGFQLVAPIIAAKAAE